MNPAKKYERLAQTFAFRAFVYGQDNPFREVQPDPRSTPRPKPEPEGEDLPIRQLWRKAA